MKSTYSVIRNLLVPKAAATALGLMLAATAALASPTSISASPNPVRQGTTLTATATVTSGNRVDFFFLGRNIATVYPSRGVARASFVLPSNVVPAGYTSIVKDLGVQQDGHRISTKVIVTR